MSNAKIEHAVNLDDSPALPYRHGASGKHSCFAELFRHIHV
jgi:hypothetical protein